uniref:Uncharacterized protein n=1 Tax=Amphilophus citrinellus TaxID=61819 RepID=A0A3Q0SBZ2_AMPCI
MRLTDYRYVIGKEVPEEPRVMYRQLKAFLTLANVHDSTIRGTLKTVFSIKITAVHLQFAKDHMDEPDGYR